MITEELKAAYIEWIEHHCNISKLDPEKLPGGIKLALEQLLKLDPLDFNITSEKLSDISMTFAATGGIPNYIYEYLKPYKKVKIL